MTDSNEARSPRQVPNHQVEKARSFARRCAEYLDLVDRPAWTEHAPGAPGGLYSRIHVNRLPATALAVYGVVRMAVRCGWDGAWISYDELAVLTGRSARSARRAIDLLCEHQLLQKVPEYCPATDGGPAAQAGYSQQRLRNAYALGTAAKVPRKAQRVWPGGGGGPPGASDRTPDKMAKLRPSGAGRSPYGDHPSAHLRSHDGPKIRRPSHLAIVSASEHRTQPDQTQPKESERSAANAACEPTHGQRGAVSSTVETARQRGAQPQQAGDSTRASGEPLRVSLAEREASRAVLAQWRAEQRDTDEE